MSDVRFEPLVKGLLWRALYAVGRSVVLHAFYPSITVITSPIDTRSIHDRPHTHAHMTTHMNHHNASTRSPHPPAYCIHFLFSISTKHLAVTFTSARAACSSPAGFVPKRCSCTSSFVAAFLRSILRALKSHELAGLSKKRTHFVIVIGA